MKAFSSILVGAAVALSFAAVLAGQAQPAAPAPTAEIAKAQQTPTPESLLGEPYMLTWEKDPRAKGREPFKTVLHFTGSETRKANTFDLPRTPSEETAFAIKAESYVEEAVAALDEADFKLAEERLETVTKMVTVQLVTQSAQDKLREVTAALTEATRVLSSMHARAALKEALELAGRMQAYFDNNRFGEVVDLHKQVLELNDEKGLRNPEVASTAEVLLAKCDELSRRAAIHLEFAQMELAVDAVSYFPQGKSYAIVNGEVIGEGGNVAPELLVAAVAVNKVIFDYKGERIALELEE